MELMAIGLVITLALAGGVVGVVAWQARRTGRQILSAEGRDLVQSARERTGEVAQQARERTGEVAQQARNKVADLSRDGDSKS